MQKINLVQRLFKVVLVPAQPYEGNADEIYLNQRLLKCLLYYTMEFYTSQYGNVGFFTNNSCVHVEKYQEKSCKM